MDKIEMVSSNDWQDCYRIMYGYLFVVNKFVEIPDKGSTYTIPKNYYKKVEQKSKVNYGFLQDLLSVMVAIVMMDY